MGAGFGHTWGTPDEIAFIDSLGLNTSDVVLVDRLPLLLSYKRGLSLRTTWTNLNRAEIEAHLDKRIAELTAKKENV